MKRMMVDGGIGIVEMIGVLGNSGQMLSLLAALILMLMSMSLFRHLNPKQKRVQQLWMKLLLMIQFLRPRDLQ